jgi:hypothetical protein
MVKTNRNEATLFQKIALVFLLLLVFFICVYMMLLFWPTGKENTVSEMRLFGVLMISNVTTEQRWFVLVIVAGALGSFVHVATSAGDYIGNRKLVSSWLFWYMLRLPVGSSLALLVYLLLRGGVLTGTPIFSGEEKELYGIVGLSALAGMFAKKAANKLADVFDTFFNSETDTKLADKMAGTQPVLEKVEPNPLNAVGKDSAVITLIGKNFRPESRVRIADELRKPIFDSDTELSVILEVGDLKIERDIEISVETPKVEDGKSNVVTLTIEKTDE